MKSGVTSQKLVSLFKIIPVTEKIQLFIEKQDEKPTFTYKYYSLEGEKERYMVQTRWQMKASGVQLPEVHGSRKGLDPHKIREKQPQPIDIDRKPRLGHGRAGVRGKIKALPSSYIGPGSS